MIILKSCLFTTKHVVYDGYFVNNFKFWLKFSVTKHDYILHCYTDREKVKVRNITINIILLKVLVCEKDLSYKKMFIMFNSVIFINWSSSFKIKTFQKKMFY